MKNKKSLESRIRGWFPSTPIQPQNHTRTPITQGSKPFINQLPPLLDAKFQRSNGLVIGLGLGLLFIGLGGALINSSAFSEVKTFFSYTGVDPNNYLYRNLIDGIAVFLTIAVAGALLSLFGVMSMKSQSFRDLYLNKKPFKRLGNFLFGLGIGSTAISFHSLFTFLLAPNDSVLNHNNFQLELFTVLLLIGVLLTITGMMIWRLKK